MPVPPPAWPVDASPLRAHALARQDATTPLGMRARQTRAPLRMRMAHPRPWRMETRAPAFPRCCPADRRRRMLEPSTPRRPRTRIAGTPRAGALGVLGHAPRRPGLGDHGSSPWLGGATSAGIGAPLHARPSSVLSGLCHHQACACPPRDPPAVGREAGRSLQAIAHAVAEDAHGGCGPCLVAPGGLATPAFRVRDSLALMTARTVDFTIGTSTHQGGALST